LRLLQWNSLVLPYSSPSWRWLRLTMSSKGSRSSGRCKRLAEKYVWLVTGVTRMLSFCLILFFLVVGLDSNAFGQARPPYAETRGNAQWSQDAAQRAQQRKSSSKWRGKTQIWTLTAVFVQTLIFFLSGPLAHSTPGYQLWTQVGADEDYRSRGKPFCFSVSFGPHVDGADLCFRPFVL
jgi:hypothetical protein